MIDELRTSRAHAFVADLADPVLEPDDAHHLMRVLRLRAGEPVTVSDGRGGWRLCEWAGAGLSPVGEVASVAPLAPPITIAFALVKGDRPEWIVQKLTELGVDRIIPLATDRSIVRWDAAKAVLQCARLARVAKGAAMQSRRVWLPAVGPLTGFSEAASWSGAARADPGGGPPSLARPAVLVGPEGGWSEAEQAADLPTVGASDAILRAETAALTFGVLLTALRVTMVRPINSHEGKGSVHPAVEPPRVVF